MIEDFIEKKSDHLKEGLLRETEGVDTRNQILKEIEAKDFLIFAKKQIEANNLTSEERRSLCGALSEFGAYVDPLSRETEDLALLLKRSCGKVDLTLFRINLKQNIDESRRPINLKLISLLGRMLSAILESIIDGEIQEGEVAAKVLERKLEPDEDLKIYANKLAKYIGLSSSAIYATELLNLSLNTKEAFISKEFPHEVLSLISRGKPLGSKINALLLLYNLMCTKNLDLERFRSLISTEFNMSNFIPLISSFVYCTVKTYSPEYSWRELNLRVYLRNNLNELIDFSGKEALLITDSLDQGNIKWIRALVWRKLFEEFMGEIREEALNDFTEELAQLVEYSPHQIVKALRSLTPPHLGEGIIQRALGILAEALSVTNSEELSHMVAEIVRNLTFSSSIKNLSEAVSSSHGKENIIKLILKGSTEVVSEVLRLFKLSSSSWWLVLEESPIKELNLNEEIKLKLREKIKSSGENADEILTSLLGDSYS